MELFQVLNSGNNPAEREGNPDAIFLYEDQAYGHINFLQEECGLDDEEYTVNKLVEFPNDFISWQETHYEVTSVISYHTRQEPISSKVVAERHEAQGTGGMYELAQELTLKFELKNKDRQWDGEFFEEITEFLEIELK